MDSSAFSITLTPAQLFVGASLLGVAILNSAKSISSMWCAMRRLPSFLLKKVTMRRDDCSGSLHGIPLFDALNAH